MTGVGLGAVIRLPRVLGMDPSGVIVAAGPGVDRRRVGQRVAVKPNLVCGSCSWCAAGSEANCPGQGVLGVHRDGGCAEFVTVPASLAFPIADGLSFAQATAAVHSASVALHMLRAAGVGAGDAVLVLGASGAVGSAAAQLAAHLGARVVTQGPVRAVIDTTGDGRLLSAAMDQLGWKGTAVTCAGRGIPGDPRPRRPLPRAPFPGRRRRLGLRRCPRRARPGRGGRGLSPRRGDLPASRGGRRLHRPGRSPHPRQGHHAAQYQNGLLSRAAATGL